MYTPAVLSIAYERLLRVESSELLSFGPPACRRKVKGLGLIVRLHNSMQPAGAFVENGRLELPSDAIMFQNPLLFVFAARFFTASSSLF